jgi:hypothetical protein
MSFYGREQLLSLADQLVQTHGGPLVRTDGYRPILVLDGCGGSGRTKFLETFGDRWAAEVPEARVMDPLAHAARHRNRSQGGSVGSAVRSMLPQILSGLGTEVPGYHLSFGRVTIAYVAMQAPVKSADPDEAKHEMLGRLASCRGARLTRLLTEAIRVTAAGVPSTPSVDSHAIAEQVAGLLTARVQRVRFLARIDRGPALLWFAPKGQAGIDAALGMLVDLSRLASSPNPRASEVVDQWLIRALLDDLRQSVVNITQRPGNCLLLLDDADSPAGMEFLENLVRARLDQIQAGMVADPLTVVAASGDLRMIGTLSKRRCGVADVTAADFGRTAAWIRVGLDDMSPLDVQNLVDEKLLLGAATDGGEAAALGNFAAQHLLYRLTGGHALTTCLALQKLENDPSLIGDLAHLLKADGLKQSESLEQYVLQKIVRTLQPRRKDIPRFWNDLAVMSAARNRDEVGYLAKFFSGPADWRERALLCDSLWCRPQRDGSVAMLPVARYFLLRKLAETQWDAVFTALYEVYETTGGSPRHAKDYENDLPETPPEAADMSGIPVPAASLADQSAGRLHHALALGRIAEASTDLARFLKASAAAKNAAAANGWLTLFDAILATPDLLHAAHQQPDEVARQQVVTRSEPEATVLGLLTELHLCADPCAGGPEVLRERYWAISNHCGRLVPYLPTATVQLLDRAASYANLAEDLS